MNDVRDGEFPINSIDLSEIPLRDTQIQELVGALKTRSENSGESSVKTIAINYEANTTWIGDTRINPQAGKLGAFTWLGNGIPKQWPMAPHRVDADGNITDIPSDIESPHHQLNELCEANGIKIEWHDNGALPPFPAPNDEVLRGCFREAELIGQKEIEAQKIELDAAKLRDRRAN